MRGSDTGEPAFALAAPISHHQPLLAVLAQLRGRELPDLGDRDEMDAD